MPLRARSWEKMFNKEPEGEDTKKMCIRQGSKFLNTTSLIVKYGLLYCFTLYSRLKPI